MRVVLKYAQQCIIQGMDDYPVYKVSDTVDINIDKFFCQISKLTDKQKANTDLVKELFLEFISKETIVSD